jgi:dTDP-4-dehydrorhamnose reductase
MKKKFKYPKILLLGGNGQLGYELKFYLKSLGNIWSPDRQDFNLLNFEQIKKKIKSYKPDLIVNAAAYTNVEKAEKEKKIARTINSLAPAILAKEANKLSIPLVHFSTDYVFDGKKKKPYTEKDKTNPLNFYGVTKLEGERAIQREHDKFLIFRTSWLYSATRGNNFYQKMLKLFKKKNDLFIVNDQTSKPTSVKYIAKKTTQIIKMLKLKQKEVRWNIYHLTEKDIMTWYQFALKIYKAKNFNYKLSIKNIFPIKSNLYSSIVKRPMFSVLDNSSVNKNFRLK